MTAILLAAAAFLVVAPGCAEAEQAASDSTQTPVMAGNNDAEMLKQAKLLQQKFLAAVNKKDLAGVMACFWNAPGLVYYPISGADILEGYDAVKRDWAAFLAQPGPVELSISNKDMQVSGDQVITHGLWTLSGKSPEGEPYEMTGRFLDITRQEDDRWVYVLEYASMALPVPGETETK